MRPNIDQAEDFLGALPYSDRRGDMRRRTDEQRLKFLAARQTGKVHYKKKYR
jgi:hypothetical protein